MVKEFFGKLFGITSEKSSLKERIEPVLTEGTIKSNTKELDGDVKPASPPPSPEPKEGSYITFHINEEDLSVEIEHQITDGVVEQLVKADYLTPVDAESEEVVNVATIVYCGDIITGIIDTINGGN